MVDPDPRTAGAGLRRLADAGLDVCVGIEAGACEALNAPFVHRILDKVGMELFAVFTSLGWSGVGLAALTCCGLLCLVFRNFSCVATGVWRMDVMFHRKHGLTCLSLFCAILRIYYIRQHIQHTLKYPYTVCLRWT